MRGVLGERRQVNGRTMLEEALARSQAELWAAVSRMVRNGYRHRSLLTPLGWVEFWLPRVRCQCGGSVEMQFEGLVRPYRRLSDLVDEQVCRWYRQGLSLRQLQADASAGSPISKRNGRCGQRPHRRHHKHQGTGG